MASNCNSLEFVDICGDAFYFQDAAGKDEVDCDIFEQTSNVSEHVLCSKDSKYLILKDRQLQAKALNQQELSSPDCRFCIHIYTDHNRSEPGMPIMLYAKQGGKKMVVCCADNGCVITPQQMDSLPAIISSSRHKAMFILEALKQNDVYMFKSTMHPDKYLGFESTDGNVKKLVLRKVTDEPECTEIRVNT